MPYADPQQKIERMRKWRKEAIKSGYGKWLYQKRKRVYADATEFEIALRQIANAKTQESAEKIARDALVASRERWDSLEHPPPVTIN